MGFYSWQRETIVGFKAKSDLISIVLLEDHCGLENGSLGGASAEAERQEDSEEAAVVIQEGGHGGKGMCLRGGFMCREKKEAGSVQCPGSWF